MTPLYKTKNVFLCRLRGKPTFTVITVVSCSFRCSALILWDLLPSSSFPMKYVSFWIFFRIKFITRMSRTSLASRTIRNYSVRWTITKKNVSLGAVMRGHSVRQSGSQSVRQAGGSYGQTHEPFSRDVSLSLI